MSNRLTSADNKNGLRQPTGGIYELGILLQELDGQPSPPDWMVNSARKSMLADQVRLYIYLLQLM